MNQAYIGLGSNLENPLEQLQSAVRALAQLPDSHIELISSVYRSAPLGGAKQPDYLNAVLLLHTEMAALELLTAMQDIEAVQGRLRGERWGPRTIDLDLILYNDLHMQTDRLTLPHPRMHERDFVLYPLSEICSDNQLLINGTDLDTLRVACADNNLERTQCQLRPG